MSDRNAFRHITRPPSAATRRYAPVCHVGLLRVMRALGIAMLVAATQAIADMPDDRGDPQLVQIMDIDTYRIVGLSQGGRASAPVRSTLSIRILGTPRDGSQVTQARVYFVGPEEELRTPRYASGLRWIEMTMPVATLPGVLALLEHPYGFVRYREWSADEREAEVNAGNRR